MKRKTISKIFKRSTRKIITRKIWVKWNLKTNTWYFIIENPRENDYENNSNYSEKKLWSGIIEENIHFTDPYGTRVFCLHIDDKKLQFVLRLYVDTWIWLHRSQNKQWICSMLTYFPVKSYSYILTTAFFSILI